MSPPTLWTRFRHAFGRALRETGQAIDRVGIRGEVHATTRRTVGDDPYKFNDHLSRHRNRMPLLRRGEPIVHDDVAYIAPCSSLIGSVKIGPGSSVWYGAVLRADRCNNGMGHHDPHWLERWKTMSKSARDKHNDMVDDTGHGGGIFIGSGTNVQDGCVVTSVEDHTIVGDNVTVGHLAQIHSATVADNSLVGMGAVLCPGSKVESQSFVAAGAVVWRGVTVPKGELWVGNPARKLRDLTAEEREKLFYQADEYVKVAKNQSHVMELGGNMPDSLIEHTLLGGGKQLEDKQVEAVMEEEDEKQVEEEEEEKQVEEAIEEEEEEEEEMRVSSR